MRRAEKLKRKAFVVDERALRRARRALGVSTDAEAVRIAVQQIAELEAFWTFMKKSRGTLGPGSLVRP